MPTWFWRYILFWKRPKLLMVTFGHFFFEVSPADPLLNLSSYLNTSFLHPWTSSLAWKPETKTSYKINSSNIILLRSAAGVKWTNIHSYGCNIFIWRQKQCAATHTSSYEESVSVREKLYIRVQNISFSMIGLFWLHSELRSWNQGNNFF